MEPAEKLLENTHPGLMLREDYMEPLGLTAYEVAKGTGLTPTHVSELLRGGRNITPPFSLLLGKYLELSPRFWLNLQNRHDMIEAQCRRQDHLARVIPLRQQQAA